MRTLLLCLVISITTGAYCKNSTELGQTFPIEEMDFRVFIKIKLTQLKDSGKLETIKKEAIKRVANSTIRPKPLNLGVTAKSFKYFVSAEQTVSKDIYLPDGRLLVKEGTKINPFHRVSLQYSLIFINGDDPRQIDWVQKHIKSPQKSKIVLTGGNIKDMNELFGRVYFDQEARITKKLSIQNVPSIASQSGDKWLIRVIGVKEMSHA